MSKIEWTGKTWNPIAGCSLVSPGCTHCYAMRMAARLEKMGQTKYAGLTKKVNKLPVWTGKINLDHDALTIPLKRRTPTTWFVNSMSDLFHEGVPFDFVDRVFAVMALTPQHTYQILTKRPGRMAEYINGESHRRSQDAAASLGWITKGDGFRYAAWPWPLPNVWLGTSVEDQQRADERIPHLLRCPAAVRFLSCEPLLGEIDLDEVEIQAAPGFFGSPLRWHHRGRCHAEAGIEYPTVDWVIVGGESGPGARRCDVGWIESIIGQCAAAGVPCFVKQLGAKPFLGDGSHPHGWPTENGPVNWETGEIRLKDAKGGAMLEEWPECLRIRQMPATAEARV